MGKLQRLRHWALITDQTAASPLSLPEISLLLSAEKEIAVIFPPCRSRASSRQNAAPAGNVVGPAFCDLSA